MALIFRNKIIADICYYLPIAMMVGGGCGIITSIIMILIHFNKNAVVFELFFSHLYGGVQAIIVDIEVDC